VGKLFKTKRLGEDAKQPFSELEITPIFYRPHSYYYREISFDGEKWYKFKKENVIPFYYTRKFDYIIEYTDTEFIRCNGHYDKEEKLLRFFYNQNLNKLYRSIIVNQKLERLNQTFLVDEDKRKEKNMSIKELRKIKSGRVDLEDAPDKIVPTRIETEIKDDPKDKVSCLYVNFFWDIAGEEATLTQKYRPFHLKILIARMDELKIKNVGDYVNKTWLLEKKPFGTLGHPHYLPTA